MICRDISGRTTCSFVEALFSGIGPGGSLFLPADWPVLSERQVDALLEMPFVERSVRLTTLLLTEELGEPACAAIARGAFDFRLPDRVLDQRRRVLELFHGPTLAFKDFGARFMARAMAAARGKRPDPGQPITILTATSGDTGSAVAQAFYEVAGIEVVVLYPAGRVSAIQEKQIATLGGNVHAFSVQGSFDDCQALVKGAFEDQDLRRRVGLTTANSINLGRLLPQTFYYFEAVAAARRARPGRPVVISVPSGNFGNLTAGILAWKMGLPVFRFVAATNENDAVSRRLSGLAPEAAQAVATLSTAMDVAAPNNWPRIEHLFQGDVSAMRAQITAVSVNDQETLETIQTVSKRTGYLLDPHSAVGYAALQRILPEHPVAEGVVLATAHPAKFSDALIRAIGHPAPLPAALAACLDLPLLDRPLPVSAAALREELLGLAGSV